MLENAVYSSWTMNFFTWHFDDPFQLNDNIKIWSFYPYTFINHLYQIFFNLLYFSYNLPLVCLLERIFSLNHSDSILL